MGRYAGYLSFGRDGASRAAGEVVDADWSPDGNQLAVIDRANDKWRLQYPIGKVLPEGDGS